MYIKKGENSAFNFIAPSGFPDKVKEVLFPVSETPDAIAYASNLAINAKQMTSIQTIEQLTGNTTINVNVDPQVTPGAILVVKLEADSSDRQVSLGTKLNGEDFTVSAGTKKNLVAVYDGDSYNVI